MGKGYSAVGAGLAEVEFMHGLDCAVRARLVGKADRAVRARLAGVEFILRVNLV